MSIANLSKEEIKEINNRFPELKENGSGFSGIISFYETYNKCEIEDTFEVTIDIPDGYPIEMPTLRETGGRTEWIAKKHNKENLMDLHRNPTTGTACVCVKQLERKKFPVGSNILTFIDELAIPYLYGLSFYEENGHWPWHEYSHGCLGILEFFAEDAEKIDPKMIIELSVIFKKDPKWEKYRDYIVKPRKKRFCPCGSEKPFFECHKKAWKGITVLHKNLKKTNLNPYEIFSR